MPTTISGDTGVSAVQNGAVDLTTDVSGVLPVANGGNGTATANASFKNRIINGAMSINQRVNSLSTNNSQAYFIDRMWGFSGLSTAATFSQQSSSGLTGFPFFARAQRNSGNTGIGGVYMGQIVESNNLQDLQGQQVTLSFWARAGANYSASGNTLAVYIRTGTTADQGLNQLIAGWAGQSDLASTVTLTTSWQYFSRTFTLASNIQELSIFFWNAVSGTAGASDFFDVTGVQLEKGSTATSFDYRPYGTELALCQRYYFRIRGNGTAYVGVGSGITVTTTRANSLAVKFPVTMRTNPSFTVGPGGIYDGNVVAAISGSTLYAQSTTDTCSFDIACATVTAFRAATYGLSNTSDIFEASAEL